ncbi:hypothetical protein [Mesorhizobium sp. INR15]|uniref:hypothetical protein n=1 Tax=Mesorhizobium sp. INR15 TaxID=2654248 RepID=UPI001896467F|nr:hypothetical protein [Mesorhizobium sp. INR15]QPC95745.1 hypothetical protein GA829_34830 [Mesorhizobium sp. INR15]
MRDLPKNIDADLVIEIGKLLDEHPHMAPVAVHQLAVLARQRVKTGLPDQSIEELVVEMATSRQLAMAFDLPGEGNVVSFPVRR